MAARCRSDPEQFGSGDYALVTLAFLWGEDLKRSGCLHEAAPQRIPYLHLKSVDPAMQKKVEVEKIPFAIAVGQDMFCEPARGTVDFTRLRLGFDPNPLQELALRAGGGYRELHAAVEQIDGGGGEGGASRVLPAGQPDSCAGSAGGSACVCEGS